MSAAAQPVGTSSFRLRHQATRTGPTVNAATPIVFGRHAFLTSSYQVGAALLQLEDNKWKTTWSNDDTLSSQYNTPIYADGYLYGIHGREDVGRAELRCVEALTGRVAWREPDFGVGHLLRIDDRLLILKVDGQLVLAKVDPQQFRVIDQRQVSTATTRALPAFSKGRLYFRENSSRAGRLICIRM